MAAFGVHIFDVYSAVRSAGPIVGAVVFTLNGNADVLNLVFQSGEEFIGNPVIFSRSGSAVFNFGSNLIPSGCNIVRADVKLAQIFTGV